VPDWQMRRLTRQRAGSGRFSPPSDSPDSGIGGSSG
jgi:hypothetical protein